MNHMMVQLLELDMASRNAPSDPAANRNTTEATDKNLLGLPQNLNRKVNYCTPEVGLQGFTK